MPSSEYSPSLLVALAGTHVHSRSDERNEPQPKPEYDLGGSESTWDFKKQEPKSGHGKPVIENKHADGSTPPLRSTGEEEKLI